MANTDMNVKALNGKFVEQYRGKNVYLAGIPDNSKATFNCPYCKLYGYASLSNLKRDIWKALYC